MANDSSCLLAVLFLILALILLIRKSVLPLFLLLLSLVFLSFTFLVFKLLRSFLRLPVPELTGEEAERHSISVLQENYQQIVFVSALFLDIR